MKIAFITIGSRDVQVDKKQLTQVLGESETGKIYRERQGRNDVLMARDGGLAIFNSFEKTESLLHYPIITPFVNSILKEGIPFSHVVLIATNQSSETAGEYASQDTLYFAKIVQRYLSRVQINNQKAFRKITILEVVKNVIYLDSMFFHFAGELSEDSIDGLKSSDEIHLCNQGGIDAINTGLMLQLLYKYGEKVRLYNVNEQTRLCTPLTFQKQFGLEQERSKMQLAVGRHDYAAAKSLNLPDNIKKLCAYAESRLNFDFDSARAHLEELGVELRESRDFEIMDLATTIRDEGKLTVELYWNALIRYEQEAYVDFIQRFFRIVEQMARDQVQLHISFQFNHHKWKEDFGSFLEKPENSPLLGHLNNYKTRSGSKLDYSSSNIEVFKAILSFKDPEIFDFLESLSPLAQLRNNGIGAHGFQPIGLQHILDRMKTDKNGFELILHKVGTHIRASENPFNRIRRLILGNL